MAAGAAGTAGVGGNAPAEVGGGAVAGVSNGATAGVCGRVSALVSGAETGWITATGPARCWRRPNETFIRLGCVCCRAVLLLSIRRGSVCGSRLRNTGTGAGGASAAASSAASGDDLPNQNRHRLLQGRASWAMAVVARPTPSPRPNSKPRIVAKAISVRHEPRPQDLLRWAVSRWTGSQRATGYGLCRCKSLSRRHPPPPANKKPGRSRAYPIDAGPPQAASSTSPSSVSASPSPSASASTLPRRGFFWSCVSISLSTSESVSFCTAAISRAMRSSAAS